MFSGKQLDKWEGSFFILWCNHLTENFTGGSSIQEEQKQNPAILDVSHKVIGVSLFAHTDTHTCKSNTRTHTQTQTHTPHGTRTEAKEEILGQWAEQYLTYLDIFLLHTSLLCDNFPTVFTTREAYYCTWMKKDVHTHSHTCARGRREKEKRVVLQLERGRYMCPSFFCDATQAHSVRAHTHTHTALSSYPDLHAKFCKASPIAWEHFHH